MTTLNQIQTKPIIKSTENNDHDFIDAVTLLKVISSNLDITFNQHVTGQIDINSKEEKENISAYLRSLLATTAALANSLDISLEKAYTSDKTPVAKDKKPC